MIAYEIRNVAFAGLSLAGLSATGSIYAQEQCGDKMPNIIYIMADDCGYGDFGCYGQQKIKTPNIDRLAANGVQFMHHYSGSTVSAPSRCALMTGKDMGHAYIRGNKGSIPDGRDWPLAESETTVAQVLKQKNYATACVGKWALGGVDSKAHPNDRGFDYFFGYLSQRAAHRYYPDHLYENETKVELDGKAHSHFLVMEKGLEFIGRNANNPFYIYFALTIPHIDLDFPDISRYEGEFEEVPFENPKFPEQGFKPQSKPRATYASMISEFDRSVERIAELLESLGILDNTIFIITSDNGPEKSGGVPCLFFDSNGPLRGMKRDLYEGGIRVPFVVSWPARVGQGRRTHHISAFWDFLPTVCEIVGAEVPEGVNGISYLPTILGDEQAQKRHKHIYFEFYEQGGKQSMLKEGWKLIRLNMGTPDNIVEELYHLATDPAEENNLIGAHSEKADGLREAMQNARVPSDVFLF